MFTINKHTHVYVSFEEPICGKLFLSNPLVNIPSLTSYTESCEFDLKVPSKRF